MKFNKININRDPLSADEISAAMNFDGLINNPPSGAPSVEASSGIGRVIKLGFYGIAAAAVVVAGFFFMNKNAEGQEESSVATPEYIEQITEDDSLSEPVVNPPIKELDLAYTSKLVSATKASEVSLGSSVVKVPENCFVDEHGNAITGEVELKYREFNNNLDIVLSGIPMEYDSAGVSHTFESNGMFEIRGFQEGEPVYMAENKSMEVAMEISEVKPGFSEYYLNEETGEWEFRNGQTYERITEEDNTKAETVHVEVIDEMLYEGGQNSPRIILDEEALAKNNEIIQELDKQIEKIAKKIRASKEPVKPLAADPAIPQIALDVSMEEFPELKGFDNTLFQVAERDLEDFDPKWGSETWNDIRVSKSTLPGFYHMVFSRPGKRVRVTCSPVVSEEELPNAMSVYNNLFDQYETAVDSLKTVKIEKEKARREELRKAREAAEEVWRLNQAANNQVIVSNGDVMSGEDKEEVQKRLKTSIQINALFMANGFGYYNCDSPIGRIANAKSFEANYSVERQGDISGNFMMIEKGRRAIFRRFQNSKLTMNPKKTNYFISISDDNKVLVGTAKKDEFVKKRNCEIVLKQCQEELTSRGELRAFLKEQGVNI